MSTDDKELARVIWNYLRLDTPVKKANVIVVLSSLDPRVAEYATQLWHEGYAPLMLFCGTGLSHKNDLLATDYGDKTESEYFAEIARTKDVPESAILIENHSQNTGENARFGYEKLRASNIRVERILVVTKPYMERRAYATFKKQWPEQATEIIMTSPQISFDEYFQGDQPFDKIANIMIGDLQRIIEYPKRGFQIEQTVPRPVVDAMNELIRHGYDKHLLPRSS